MNRVEQIFPPKQRRTNQPRTPECARNLTKVWTVRTLTAYDVVHPEQQEEHHVYCDTTGTHKTATQPVASNQPVGHKHETWSSNPM